MSDDKKGKKEEKKDDKKDALKADDKKLAAKKGGEEEGESAEGAEVADEGTSSFNAKKIILFGIVPLVLLLGVGGGAYFMGYLDKFLPGYKIDCTKVKEGDKEYANCAEQTAKEAAGILPGTFVTLPDLIVNLNTATKQPHFLKMTVKVELEKKEDEKAMGDIMPRVVDQFQTYLRELRLEDLRGSSGLYRMKIELLNRVKAAAPDIKVRDVLFQEILVQ